MLRKFFPFLPALAVCTLIAFAFHVGMTMAEKVGIICCEMSPIENDGAPSSETPDHTSVCDCATHLHPLLSPGEPFFPVTARPLTSPSFAPFVDRDPGSFIREITQPPRLS